MCLNGPSPLLSSPFLSFPFLSSLSSPYYLYPFNASLSSYDALPINRTDTHTPSPNGLVPNQGQQQAGGGRQAEGSPAPLSIFGKVPQWKVLLVWDHLISQTDTERDTHTQLRAQRASWRLVLSFALCMGTPAIHPGRTVWVGYALIDRGPSSLRRDGCSRVWPRMAFALA
jgi:hypothetical protein